MELEVFDALLQQQLHEQVAQVVTALSAYVGSPVNSDISIEGGTRVVELLHRSVDDEALVKLLAEAMLGLTNQRWTLSVCDPALAGVTEISVTLLLHPAGMAVDNLAAVPFDWWIFRLLRRPPYTMWAVTPHRPEHIAQNRQVTPQHVALAQAKRQLDALYERAMAVVKRELDRRGYSGDPAVVLARQRCCVSQGYRHPRAALGHLLEAAALLGVLDQV